MQSSRIHSLIATGVGWCAVFSVLFAIFGGAARYYLAHANALIVNNLPNIFTMCLFVAYYLESLRRRQLNRFMLIFLMYLVFFIVYSFTTPLSFYQILMGFYIWIYFLLGVLVCLYKKEETLFKWMLIFWGISVFGVLLNYFVDYPWIGESYEVAGTKMESARAWSAEGVSRLPGFSRISFSVACHILLTCSYILTSRKYANFLKLFVYFVSCLAIFLTTSKTELVLVLVLPFVWFAYKGLQRLLPSTKAAFIYARGLIIVLVCLVIFMPLLLSTHQQIKMTGPIYGFITGDTLVQRITQMWPEAFDLLEKDGNPIFGRGIGGIGTGLAMQDPRPETVNAADNLFVYLYVEAGYFAVVPFFLAFFVGLGQLYRNNPEYFEIIWMLSFCLLGISITAPSAEESVLAIFLGMVVARGFIRKTVKGANEPEAAVVSAAR